MALANTDNARPDHLGADSVKIYGLERSIDLLDSQIMAMRELTSGPLGRKDPALGAVLLRLQLDAFSTQVNTLATNIDTLRDSVSTAVLGQIANVSIRDLSSAQASAQEQSPLFRLPQELRDEIYSHVFASGLFPSDPGHPEISRHVECASLALLRTCRRISSEIGDTWLGKAIFRFTDICHALDVLTALPVAKLSMLRHMDLPIEHPVIQFSPVYFKFFWGLKLDTLYVSHTGNISSDAYRTLDALVREGNGWKELRFWGGIFVAEPDARDFHRRLELQPSAWRKDLIDRDGAESNPSLDIYETKEGQDPSANSRDLFRHSAWKPHGEPLRTCREISAPLLTIVKRGAGVNYIEDGSRLEWYMDFRDVYGYWKMWPEARSDVLEGWPPAQLADPGRIGLGDYQEPPEDPHGHGAMLAQAVREATRDS